MRKAISSGGRAFILCIGLSALSIGGANAKMCSAPIAKVNGGGLCVASCQFGCGVHVSNKAGAPDRGCSQFCFDRNGRLIDNVKFNARGQQIVTPTTPTPPPVTPTTKQPTTIQCPPGSSGGTPFGGGCITVRPPVAKSPPRSPPPPP